MTTDIKDNKKSRPGPRPKRTPFRENPLEYLDQSLANTYVPEGGILEAFKAERDRAKAPGGRGTHPNSQVALAANRKRTQIGGPGSRTCTQCGRLAVRGVKVCFYHGGGAVAKAQREARGIRTSRVRAAKRAVKDLLERHSLPMDLLRTELFRSTWARANQRRTHAETIATEQKELDYRRACSLLSWEVVRAWYSMEGGDIAPWVDCVRKARDLGII